MHGMQLVPTEVRVRQVLLVIPQDSSDSCHAQANSVGHALNAVSKVSVVQRDGYYAKRLRTKRHNKTRAVALDPPPPPSPIDPFFCPNPLGPSLLTTRHSSMGCQTCLLALTPSCHTPTSSGTSLPLPCTARRDPFLAFS